MLELTDKKNSIFGFVWFCLAVFGFNGYNLVTVNWAGINKQPGVEMNSRASAPYPGNLDFQNVIARILHFFAGQIFLNFICYHFDKYQ